MLSVPYLLDHVTLTIALISYAQGSVAALPLTLASHHGHCGHLALMTAETHSPLAAPRSPGHQWLQQSFLSGPNKCCFFMNFPPYSEVLLAHVPRKRTNSVN